MLVHISLGKVTQLVSTGPALCSPQVCRPQEAHEVHAALGLDIVIKILV